MDLNAIPLAESVHGEAILPPSHHGRVHEHEPEPMEEPVAPHECCPDCGDDPDDHTLHAVGCRRIDAGPLQFGPPWKPWLGEPYEPVCDACGGNRYVYVHDGRSNQRQPCPECVMRGLA